MATKKAPVKKDSFIWDVLAAADTNCKSAWVDFTDAERKNVSLFTLNRWMSSIEGSSVKVEDQLLAVNELYNKDLFSIMADHPQLTWMTACSSNYDSNIQRHTWIKASKESSKKEKFLADLYPHMKLDDIKVLASLTSNKDIKEHCESLGWTKKAINGLKL